MKLIDRGSTSVDLSVLDPTVDWPNLVYGLEGGTATLSRWDGTSAEVYSRGEISGLRWGARDEPVALTVESVAGSALGYAVPDPLARVDATTWPLAGGTISDEGRVYPIVFGYPGYESGTTSGTYPVVPVPMAQYTGAAATTYVIVAQLEQAYTECRIYNATTDIEATETVATATDLLGRSVRVAHFTADAGPMPYLDDAHDLYAGYSPAGGSVTRDAYSVLLYLLRRGRATDVDWARLPEVRDLVSQYQVDTWIDAPVTDPWAWAEGTILPVLPVEVRVSERGRYLVERRYLSDTTRVVGDVSVERGEATIVGGLSLEAVDPVNEYYARFRASREGDWRGAVVLTGSSGVAAAPGTTSPVVAGAIYSAVVRSGRCAASQARYGLRQQAAPTEYDWTWDEGTVIRCLQVQAARYAIPSILARYEIRDGHDLREGDELRLTDLARGLDSVSAIVDAAPVVSSTTVLVNLRIPRLS